MKLATLTAAILVSTISMGAAATPLTKLFDDFDVLASPSVSTSDENGNGVARSK